MLFRGIINNAAGLHNSVLIENFDPLYLKSKIRIQISDVCAAANFGCIIVRSRHSY